MLNYYKFIVNVDFFIRHGYITPDEEPNFQDIITRLHGRFDYDKWDSGGFQDLSQGI